MKKVLSFNGTAEWVRNAVVSQIAERTKATAEIRDAGPMNCGTLIITAKTEAYLNQALQYIVNHRLFRTHFKEAKS